jgi:hypothetical protein
MLSSKNRLEKKGKPPRIGKIVAAVLLFVFTVGLVMLAKIAVSPLFTTVQSFLDNLGLAWVPFDIVISAVSWAVMWYRFRDSDSLVVLIGEEIVRRLNFVVIQRLREVKKEQRDMHEGIREIQTGQEVTHEKLDEIGQMVHGLEELIKRKVPAEYKEPDRAGALMYFLFTARLDILSFRTARLKEKGKSPSVWVDFSELDRLKEQMEEGTVDSLEVLLAYDRMLVSLFHLYDSDQDAIKKITAEMSRLLSDPRQSFVQVHECDNCSKGYVAKYKDNTPGFREVEYYWCGYCKESSRVGDLVLYDSESYEAQNGSIPDEYLKHMEWLQDEGRSGYFEQSIWMKSSAFIRPATILIERDPQEIVARAQEFLLLPLNVEDLSDVDWNDYVARHREYLDTAQGLEAVRKKVEAGVFGFCKKCGIPLLPYCPEYKVYRDSLSGWCPCCKAKKELYPPVDGVVYSYVFEIEPYSSLPWVRAIVGRCPKDSTSAEDSASS